MTDFPPSGDAPRIADALSNARIVDARGRQVSLVSLDQAGADALALVQVANGPQARVPASLFALQSDGTYRLPFSFDMPAEGDTAQQRFPVVAEELHVGKQPVDTGRGVRLHKTVSADERFVDVPLLQDELVVERVPVGTDIADPDDLPQPRYEGDTLVMPVLEEVLVVRKQLRLKEEVRVTRHRREAHAPHTITLRTEHVTVERFDDGAGSDARP